MDRSKGYRLQTACQNLPQKKNWNITQHKMNLFGSIIMSHQGHLTNNIKSRGCLCMCVGYACLHKHVRGICACEGQALILRAFLYLSPTYFIFENRVQICGLARLAGRCPHPFLSLFLSDDSSIAGLCHNTQLL